jgi:hypothetical protein
MNIEHKVLKYRLCKSNNKIIFKTVYNIYSGENLLKIEESYTFSVTIPLFRKTYLMVANFPDEEGFIQVQIIDEIKQFLEQQSFYLPVIRDLESLDLVDLLADP